MPGTFTAIAGTGMISLAGASIIAGDTCTYTLDVKGTQTGNQPNPAVNVTDDQNDPATFPTVQLTVTPASPPSILAAFGTTLLGLDGTTSLTFTISNPNSDAGLTGVGFTDTLPSGIVVVGPNGVGSTCGGTVTAVGQAIALARGAVPTGGSCSVSENVMGTSAGRFVDTSSAVTSNEGGAGNAASAMLTVIGAPVVSVTSPVGGAKYAFGEKVRASYSCADDPNGPGVSSCIGTVANQGLINTGDAGEQSFSLVAISRDGGIASDIVFYTVAPNNHVNLGHVTVHRDGSIDFAVAVPEPGRIDILAAAPDRGTAARATARRPSRGHFAFGRAHAVVKRATRLHFTMKPNARGRQAVRTGQDLHVVVWVTFTPHGGTARTISFQVRIAASTQT
jgi:uncharacterized repeat protein (TIGR01451 family)